MQNAPYEPKTPMDPRMRGRRAEVLFQLGEKEMRKRKDCRRTYSAAFANGLVSTDSSDVSLRIKGRGCVPVNVRRVRGVLNVRQGVEGTHVDGPNDRMVGMVGRCGGFPLVNTDIYFTPLPSHPHSDPGLSLLAKIIQAASCPTYITAVYQCNKQLQQNNKL